MRNLLFFCGVLCAASAPVMSSQAATIEIQFTGVDVVYDGSTVTDANPAGADPLSTATLEIDGVPTASSPFVSGLSLDFEIPSITDIDKTGDAVSSVGGSLTLEFPGGDFLSLDLVSSTITFLDAAGFAQFAFAGSVAEVSAQLLPDDAIIGGPIEVSLSTQITSMMDDGVNLTSFTSSGTGEVRGILIPEPSAMGLLALGGFAFSNARRARRG